LFITMVPFSDLLPRSGLSFVSVSMSPGGTQRITVASAPGSLTGKGSASVKLVRNLFFESVRLVRGFLGLPIRGVKGFQDNG
jgi:hypothetical protein